MPLFTYCQNCDLEVEQDDAHELQACTICEILVCLGCSRLTPSNDLTCRYCYEIDPAEYAQPVIYWGKAARRPRIGMPV